MNKPVVATYWKRVNIAEVADYISDKFVPAKTGSQTIKYIGLEHIIAHENRLTRHGLTADIMSTKMRFHRQDILLGKLRPYLNKVVLAPFAGVCSTDILVIRAKDDIMAGFLLRVLSSNQLVSHAVESAAGNIMPRTSWQYLQTYQFYLPPLLEQQKIAAILASVDEVIEKTLAQINKLKDLKRASMERLFTRGLEHTEYQSSPVGNIPVGWEIKQLGELLTNIVGGGTPARNNAAYWGGDIPWATVKDLRASHLSMTAECISDQGLYHSAARLIPANTIIIATRMALGKAAVFDRDVTINQDLKALFPKANIATEFLHQWLLSQAPLLASLGTGSTVKGIRLEVLTGLKLALPPLHEQQKITSILVSIDTQIKVRQAKLKHIKALKKALLQNLLAGHKQVLRKI
ncbi:MAG: restriction endonuclease subunit S [Gammaproteobacteria bacterium]|nr:restriction endonuclease subunit S [Gammaproteobacteria bacterium]